MNGLYTGRLASDGNGNLLADEAQKVGERDVVVHDENGDLVLGADGQAITLKVPILKFGKNHGLPVAFHDGSYVFLQPGEPSHNERYHQNNVGVQGTQVVDPAEPGYAGTADEPVAGNEHHFGVTEDDAHYDADSPTGVRLKFDPDSIAPIVTGHTEANQNG